MQRSARTAHTIRPSRSGSSTMQLATGQAAWQIEQANAPKQRSGSMTAIVFGAFLRGPLIILVHMGGIMIRDPSGSADDVAGGRVADFRHDAVQRRRVLPDRRVHVGRKKPRVARLGRIGGG